MRHVGIVVVLLCWLPSPAAASGSVPVLIPPVDAAIGARFDPPASAYGPGHRGIDFVVPPGTRVRAAAPGVVTFAGHVADTLAVTVAHEGALKTTYSILSSAEVERGDRVDEGTWLGTTGEAHPGHRTGLHFGVVLAGRYVDPLAYIGEVDAGAAIHLAPLVWQPTEILPTGFPAVDSALTYRRSCRERSHAPDPPIPPNDNVAVAVAGIASKTEGGVAADIYEHGPETLGYPPGNVYRFSYAGISGPDLHRPYARTDTYGDIRAAARRLGDLLRAVARKHPGLAVDLVAHSQGGIVARTFLELQGRAFDPGLPRVEHLITFATPHGGAPVTESLSALAETAAGDMILDAASRWARAGGPLPDPSASAVRQLRAGSALLSPLAREDVMFGTRVLALAIPNDAVVPADRALWPGERGAIVAPAGLNGHSAIVWSREAAGLAHSFLRDAAPACAGTWESWGPRIGRVVSWAEANAGRVYRWGERALWP